MTDRIIIDDPDRTPAASAPRTVAIGDGTRAVITLPRFAGLAGAHVVGMDERRAIVLAGNTNARPSSVAAVFDPAQLRIGSHLVRPPKPRYLKRGGKTAILGYVCAVENVYRRSHAGIVYKSTRTRNSAGPGPRSQAKRRRLARGRH